MRSNSKNNYLHESLLMFMLFSVLFSSCTKDELMNESSIRQKSGRVMDIRIGDKIESPFLLRNMQRSVDSLTIRMGLKSKTILKPTHFYVRFLPSNEVEYDQLVADTTLDFDSYPLDCKLTEGDYYHDPSLPEDAITWQYTVVPVEYDFGKTGIEYEILEDLYILDEDLEREDLTVGGAHLCSGNRKSLSWKSVVDEALIQTGSLGGAELRSKWTPAATIKAYDDRMNTYVPLQGVKVRIRYFAFLKAYHYTDVYGNVSFGSKRTSVEYSIEWERDMWDIRDGGTQAYYNGPDQKGRWNLNINSGTQKSLHYSAIHRALYKYYYGDCCGLVRPDKRLKISYQTGSDPDGFALGSTAASKVRTWNWIFSAIKIYEKGKIARTDGTVGESVESVSSVLSTTLHELAHASHACRMSRNDYDNTSLFIKESWAVAVEWCLTLDEYRKLGVNLTMLSFLDNIKGEQEWPDIDRALIYSPLFIDMIDSYNQGKSIFTRPFDEVSGYTMPLIDYKLTTMKNYVDIENFMKNNRPSNVTVDQINNLLKMYKQKWIN
ncbi:MAG: hypothetical protein IJ916_12545 [Paludibacteraceae bacterium]|nr:hypothetical protein [Paludibacteraceae bacterium]